jgi:plastocyanin
MFWKREVLGFCVVSAVLWAGASDIARAEALYTAQLTARDGRFYPETLRVPAGQRVKIVFRNEGPGIEEFHSNDLRREEVVLPGKTATFVLSPLKPGVYRFIGELHPDTAKGQVVAE